MTLEGKVSQRVFCGDMDNVVGDYLPDKQLTVRHPLCRSNLRILSTFNIQLLEVAVPPGSAFKDTVFAEDIVGVDVEDSVFLLKSGELVEGLSRPGSWLGSGQ